MKKITKLLNHLSLNELNELHKNNPNYKIEVNCGVAELVILERGVE